MVRRISDVLKGKAITLALVMNLALWGYTLIRCQTVSGFNAAMLDIHADMSAAATDYKVMTESYGQRLDRLESYVYGTIQKAVDDKKRPITSAAEWQRNRDIQISKRLSALEDWRQRTEGR